VPPQAQLCPDCEVFDVAMCDGCVGLAASYETLEPDGQGGEDSGSDYDESTLEGQEDEVDQGEQDVQTLLKFGFSRANAGLALAATNGDVNAAMAMIVHYM